MLKRWRRRVRALTERHAVEAEMDEEMRFHLEMEIEDRIREGMTPEEARRTALRDFGGVERFKDEVRDRAGIGLLEGFARDLRLSLRMLRRAPGFAAMAVLTLGIGIGAATAIFSVVDGVLLRALPYPEPDRIVQLWHIGEEGQRGAMSNPNYEDIARQSRSFAALAQYGKGGTFTVLGASEPVRARTMGVSRDFFRVLGVRPVLGRGFVAEEQQEGGSPAAVVSHAFWERYLGADPNFSERVLRIDGRPIPVVGVMPPGFSFPEGAELWFPSELNGREPSRTAHNWSVIGRLRDGVTPEQAGAEVSAIARALKAQYGSDTWMYDAALVPLHEQIVGKVRPVLLVLLGAAVFLLVIAAANVGNLLLARLTVRSHEIAVRFALGAGRGQVARQLLAESLTLSLAGGAVGVGLALLWVRLLRVLAPPNLPRIDSVRVDWRVLAFAVGVCVLIALALALAATFRGTRGDLRRALSEGQRTQAGGESGQRIRDGLVVVQVALTLVLLVGAGLLGRSLTRLLAVDAGYRTEGALVLDLALPYPQDEGDELRLIAFHHRLFSDLRRIPGVEQVGAINAFPLGGNYSSGRFLIQTHPDEVRDFEDFGRLMDDPSRSGDAGFRVANAGYFRAMGIPVIRGRLFDERDHPDAPHAAVISESLARTRWPGEDPIGKLIQFGNMDGDMRPLTIVGIVGDVRERGIDAEPQPVLYANLAQRVGSAGHVNIVLRTPADPAAAIEPARRVLREIDPEVPPRFRTLEEIFARSLAERRFSLLLLGAFAGTALLLAMIGIYGIISYLVAQRTREIGIRIAFGARVGDVLRLVVRRGVALTLAGIGVGLLAALGLTRLLASLLYGTSTTDPAAFGGVVLVLLIVAAGASYLPARRAARVDPIVAMRAE
jgi:putative ABC transport system permease protein